MGKSFFDVFPALKLDEHTREIMEQTTVEKVSTTRKQDVIRVYISSSKLIDKTDILKTENGIKKQLFGEQDLTVKIYEKFSLSAQYTPSNLIDLYRESIEMELKDYDHMEYSLFRSAQFLFPDDGNIVVQLEDSVVGQKKAPDLLRVLSKIINERCGLTASISSEFVKIEKENTEPDYSVESAKMAQKLEAAEKASEKKKKEQLEKKQEKETAASEKSAPSGDAKGSADKSGNAQAGKENADGKPSFGKGSFSKGGSFGRRGDFGDGYKRSDNPDVIFGRDFDDEAMKLVDVVGELGEITIHGQIIAYDQRDIKNEKSILIYDVTDFTDTITVKMFVKTEDVPEITKDIKP